MYTDIRQKNSAVLKLSYTAFQVTSCNSGLTFARISVQKVGDWGTRPPCRKKWEMPSPRPTAPLISTVVELLFIEALRIYNCRSVVWRSK